MNKQKMANFAAFTPALFLAFLGCWICSTTNAQTTLYNDQVIHRYTSNQQYQDIKIADGTAGQWLFLEVRGGDGGRSSSHPGGGGATARALFKIGTADNELAPGSLIRLIPGQKGAKYDATFSIDGALGGNDKGAGGGGGSAVLYLPSGKTDWTSDGKILLVGGGGGGAGWSGDGKSANTGVAGIGGNDMDGDTHNGGADGEPGKSGENSTGGAAAKKNGSKADNSCSAQSFALAGFPAGGSGSVCERGGGWGFGGGGNGFRSGGGGGGVSGGGAGRLDHGGGGGGSYVNGHWSLIFKSITANPQTNSSADGYVRYGITTLKSIHLSKNQAKCLDLNNSSTDNGNNVQLATCQTDINHQWQLDGNNIRLARAPDKCLDLNKSNTANGSNIQLFDCNNTNAQKWIYDGLSQNIRSGIDQNKCLDLVNGKTTDGNNIQLWDCKDIGAQKWLIDGVSTVAVSSTKNRIQYLKDKGMCIDVQAASTANGANVQIYHCHEADSQYWFFDGNAIRFNKDRNKCLDLSNSKTGNGTNIQLFDCNGTNAQKWTYDGVTQSFHSWVDPDKCLDVLQSGTADHTNIQLYDCNGTDAQQFMIGN